MADEHGLYEQRLLGLFVDQLGSDGWDVKLTSTLPAFSIEIDHPLSMPQGFVFLRDADHDTFIAQILSNREFEVVRRRPRQRTNWKLLQALRQAATANHWAPEVLTTVGLVLRSQKILSLSEATWLMDAGPVFQIEAVSKE